MTWVLDLDGVVWRGDRPLPGAADAIARLRKAGRRVVFLTNNSSQEIGAFVAKLAGFGIPATPDDVLSSAQAAATLIEPGERVVLCAGAGARESLVERGAELVAEGPADAVVVGFHREFDFGRLTTATTAVLGGARLIGTNDDATFPAPDGLLPGAGAILAAVAYAGGVTPTVAGKPNQAVVELLRNRVGVPEMVVGDRPSTDGLLAKRLNVPFALVRSGVTPSGAPTGDTAPVLDGPDLAAVVELALGG